MQNIGRSFLIALISFFIFSRAFAAEKVYPDPAIIKLNLDFIVATRCALLEDRDVFAEIQDLFNKFKSGKGLFKSFLIKLIGPRYAKLCLNDFKDVNLCLFFKNYPPRREIFAAMIKFIFLNSTSSCFKAAFCLIGSALPRKELLVLSLGRLLPKARADVSLTLPCALLTTPPLAAKRRSAPLPSAAAVASVPSHPCGSLFASFLRAGPFVPCPVTAAARVLADPTVPSGAVFASGEVDSGEFGKPLRPCNATSLSRSHGCRPPLKRVAFQSSMASSQPLTRFGPFPQATAPVTAGVVAHVVSLHRDFPPPPSGYDGCDADNDYSD